MATIYGFYFEEAPNDYYIGKTTVVVSNRFNRHLSAMRRGIHHSKKVQEYYNRYNTIPKLCVLEENAPLDTIDSLEQSYIVEFDAYHAGLNMTSGGEGVGYGPFSANSKYSKLQVLKVFAMLIAGKLPITGIAKRARVHPTLVKSIRIGESHSWLHYDYPEEWQGITSRERLFNDTPTLQRLGKKLAAFKSPTGELYLDIPNIYEFARQHSFPNPLSAGKMLSAVYIGTRGSYLGWVSA